MKANTAIIIGILVVAVLAVLAFYYAGQQSGNTPQIGVSQEEINNLAANPELNVPSDIGAEENLPNPETDIVVDENDVTMELPSDI
jgi:hypothetical protein